MAGSDEPEPDPVATSCARTFCTGPPSEARAAAFLMARGYRIIIKRFHTPHGEIDFMARRRKPAGFIEVKVRDDTAYAVSRAKRRASSLPRKSGRWRIQSMTAMISASPPS